MSSYVDSSTGSTYGTIAVYYDDISNTRQILATYTLTDPLAPGQETVISFTPPTDNVKPDRYVAVFRGKLGNEEGAVIGKIVLPMSVYYVANTSEGWKILKTNGDGTNQSVVYDNINGQVIGRIAVSPDGNTLAFSSSPDGLIVNTTIQLLDLTDPAAEPRVLTAGNWPSWSPDGRKVVFEREQDIGGDANFDVFTVDVATGATSQLTSDGDSMEPAWSSNGNTIAFTQFEPAEANCNTLFVIYLISTAGNPIGPLTCPPEGEYMSDGDFEPAWSPNSQEIAFTRQKYFGRANQLHKVNVATRTITKLTESPDVGYDEFTPAWSSDGTSIAIGSARDGDYDIWLVNAQGEGYIANLTNSNPNTDGYPAFGK